MDLREIRLRNWKSHRDSTIRFDQGVNCLVGEMGAGKSGVLEAIVYVLYGTTAAVKSRDITLDQLIRRTPTKADEASVELVFGHGGEEYHIERVLKRGKGTETSKLKDEDGTLVAGPQATDVTEAVTSILGMGYVLFSEIIYARQNGIDYFLQLSPRERKEKIDSILGLERFEEARGNAVTVLNRVRDRRSDRRSDLEEMKQRFDEDKYDSVSSSIKEKKEELGSLKQRIDERKDEYEEVESRVEYIQEEKERLERLRSSRDSIKGTIDQIVSEMTGLAEDVDGPVGATSIESCRERKEELAEQRDVIQGKREALAEARSSLESVVSQVEQLEDQRGSLEEKKEEQEGLDAVEESIDALEESIDAKKASITEAKTRMEQLVGRIEQLLEAENTCPVCGCSLSADHREELLEKRRDEREKLEEELSSLQSDLQSAEEEMASYRKERKRLLRLGDIDERLSEVDERLDRLGGRKDDLEDRIDSLQDDLAEYDLEHVRERLEEVSTVEEILVKRQSVSDRLEKYRRLSETIDDVSFDREVFEEEKEKLSEMQAAQEADKAKVNSIGEQVEQLEEQRSELEERRERIAEIEEVVEDLGRIRRFLERFRDVLLEVQERLRDRYIGRINDVLVDVWSTVYPYEDYQSIRLDVSDDYILQVRDDQGNWIHADAAVSGGERHTAALTLRIALSTVLAPDVDLILLDEPTHNLDERAVEDMIAMLRSTADELVDQVVVITHETALESAVTGRLYRISKDHDGDGCTRVEDGLAV